MSVAVQFPAEAEDSLGLELSVAIYHQSQEVVSVVEILRAYVSVYAEVSYWLGFNVQSVYGVAPGDPHGKSY